MKKYDVVIIGAGPAGIGMCINVKRFWCRKDDLLERGQVDETFDKWPEEIEIYYSIIYN